LKNIIKILVNKYLLKVFNLKLYSTKAFGREITLDIKRIVDKPKVMFDVGANVGQTVDLWRNEFDNPEIHSFEPVKRLFAELQKNVANKAICNHMGVGDLNGELTIHYGKHDVSHSFIYDELGKGSEKTKVVTLDSYCETKGIEHIDVLKIDVEGFENNVIDGASELLSSKRVDILEVELGFDPEGYYTFYSDFTAKLALLGYFPLGFYDQTTQWNGSAQLLFCNVLFTHKGVSFEN